MYDLHLYYLFFECIFVVYAETTIHCSCRQGYTGNGIGINGCVLDERRAIDPCENKPCGSHGLCIANENNSFVCICNTGFSGDLMNTF